MEKETTQTTQKRCRKNERGAALIMVLMISFLLLVAVIGVLLEASMNTANVTDATAEDQAYYAAESGIQDTINALRGNSQYQKTSGDPITYFKTVNLCTSNNSCDCMTKSCSSSWDNEVRLSKWLPYSLAYPDRVILGGTTSATQPAYTPETGFAYKIKVENPDNIGNIVSYSTRGNIAKAGNTFTTNGVTIEYFPKSISDLDVSSGSANNKNGDDALFGNFSITGNGTISSRIRFAINVDFTTPYNTTMVIRGYIEPGTVTATSVGVNIFYDSQIYVVTGSTITLSGGTIIEEKPPAAGTGEGGTYRTGYQVTPNLSSTKITGSITAPEPIRLRILSTGFAPRGAQKQLETIILKNYFNGLSAPSPLTLIGPPITFSPLPLTKFVFDPGTSTGTSYNGKDVNLKIFLPPIGVTDDLNLDKVNEQIKKSGSQPFNGTVYGTASNVTNEMPFWLQTPTNLDATLQQLKDVAKASGRYYEGATRPANGDYGNNSNATGITYIKGDLEFSQYGGGILVVTGGLTFKGGFNFNGLIIVTGEKGISRTGGGSGVLQGNMIVAPYLPDDLTKGFLAPNYSIGGGGGSEIVYNSNNVANGLGALNNFVKGVAEK